MNKITVCDTITSRFCLGYLVFSFTVLERSNFQGSRRDIIRRINKFVHMNVFKMIYLFPIESLEDIDSIKDELKQATLDSSVAMTFFYVPKEEFVKYYENFRMEFDDGRRGKKK